MIPPTILTARWYPHDLALVEEVAVIGDVHGLATPFAAVLDAFDRENGLRVVQLGDLIDRKPKASARFGPPGSA